MSAMASTFVGAGDTLDGSPPTTVRRHQGSIVADVARWGWEVLLLVAAVAHVAGLRVWRMAQVPGLAVDVAAFGCAVAGTALLWSPGAGFLAASAALLALNSRYGPR